MLYLNKNLKRRDQLHANSNQHTLALIFLCRQLSTQAVSVVTMLFPQLLLSHKA